MAAWSPMETVTSCTKTETLKMCLFLFHYVTCSNFQGKFKTPKKYYTSKRKIITIMVHTKMSVPCRKINRSLLSVLTCIVDNIKKISNKDTQYMHYQTYHVNVPNINLSTYNRMNKFNNIPPDIKSLNHVMCKNTYTSIKRKSITLLLFYTEFTSIINSQLLLKNMYKSLRFKDILLL